MNSIPINPSKSKATCITCKYSAEFDEIRHKVKGERDYVPNDLFCVNHSKRCSGNILDDDCIK